MISCKISLKLTEVISIDPLQNSASFCNDITVCQINYRRNCHFAVTARVVAWSAATCICFKYKDFILSRKRSILTKYLGITNVYLLALYMFYFSYLIIHANGKGLFVIWLLDAEIFMIDIQIVFFFRFRQIYNNQIKHGIRNLYGLSLAAFLFKHDTTQIFHVTLSLYSFFGISVDFCYMNGKEVDGKTIFKKIMRVCVFT